MVYFSNIKLNNDELSFELNNNDTIKTSFANAIRRLIISHVPTISINEESINFEENTSMLHNSFLSKRLALLPINYNEINKYDINNLTFSLDRKNTDYSIISIYSGDIIVKNLNDVVSNIFIKDDILFSKLKPDQHIKFSGQFRKSNSATNGTYYTPTCKSTLSYKIDEKALEKLDETTQKNEKERYYLKNKKDEPAVFIISIESIGMLAPMVIINSALNILKNKLETLLDALNKDNDEKIKLFKSDKLFESYNFLIIDENHTLGNLIETYLLDNENISYSGYIIPHPNDNKLLITTALQKDNTLENNKKVFINTLEKLIKINSSLIDEWGLAENSGAQKKPQTKKISIKKV